MNILMISFIFVIWVFSIFAFAKWRVRSKVQNGDIWVSALHDGATKAFLIGTGIILLMLIFFLLRNY